MVFSKRGGGSSSYLRIRGPGRRMSLSFVEVLSGPGADRSSSPSEACPCRALRRIATVGAQLASACAFFYRIPTVSGVDFAIFFSLRFAFGFGFRFGLLGRLTCTQTPPASPVAALITSPPCVPAT